MIQPVPWRPAGCHGRTTMELNSDRRGERKLELTDLLDVGLEEFRGHFTVIQHCEARFFASHLVATGGCFDVNTNPSLFFAPYGPWVRAN